MPRKCACPILVVPQAPACGHCWRWSTRKLGPLACPSGRSCSSYDKAGEVGAKYYSELDAAVVPAVEKIPGSTFTANLLSPLVGDLSSAV